MVSVPELTPELRVLPAEQAVPLSTDGKPTLVPLVVKLAPARQFVGCQLSLTYDPAVIEPLYVSRGEAFVEAGRLLSPWSAGQTGEGRISGLGGERREAPALSAPEVTLFTVVFMAKAPGETALALEPTSLLGSGSRQMDFRVVGAHVTVRVEEESK